LREVQEAAHTIGLQTQILNATTIGEIDAAFAALARERSDALFVAGDGFFLDRRVQFATLAARYKIPATYSTRELVAAGGVMSYGTDVLMQYRQAATYVDRILRGAKPADLPVEAPKKYETVLNLKTAKALGFEVPPTLLVRADEVIE
jgi:putative ABC transport system substrate-binding protein